MSRTTATSGKNGAASGAAAVHSLDTEVGDLTALVLKTGATQMFGLSSGGLIALATALRAPQIRQLAIYEPALAVDGGQLLIWMGRTERYLDANRPSAALATLFSETADRDVVAAELHQFLTE
ncbi:hypothetical protein [Nocardia sp. NPDC059239]|uniref:hypothetical protein n=1 Tax=unclassified Nocardia TaxID=2637762 RepID=UPI0036CFFD2D